MDKESKYVKQEAIRATAGKEFLVLKECLNEMYNCIDDLLVDLKYYGRAEQDAIGQTINLQRKALKALKLVPKWRDERERRRIYFEKKQDSIKQNILHFEELPLFDAYPIEEREKKEDKRVRFIIYKLGKLSIHDSVDSRQPLKTV